MVRPRRGSAAICSRCHQPASGYDQLAERHFEFIPLWGFFCFLLYTMRRVDCRRCCAIIVEESSLGRRQPHFDQSLDAVSCPRGTPPLVEGDRPVLSYVLGKVFDAVEHVVTYGLEHRHLGQIDAIGVDETQYAKASLRNNISKLECSSVFWGGDRSHRNQEALLGFESVAGRAFAPFGGWR